MKKFIKKLMCFVNVYKIINGLASLNFNGKNGGMDAIANLSQTPIEEEQSVYFAGSRPGKFGTAIVGCESYNKTTNVLTLDDFIAPLFASCDPCLTRPTSEFIPTLKSYIQRLKQYPETTNFANMLESELLPLALKFKNKKLQNHKKHLKEQKEEKKVWQDKIHQNLSPNKMKKAYRWSQK